MRAPVMAMGCPRLQPLPRTFTIDSSIPRILVVATHIEANASLISHRATSSIRDAGPPERLGNGDGRGQTRCPRAEPPLRPMP